MCVFYTRHRYMCAFCNGHKPPGTRHSNYTYMCVIPVSVSSSRCVLFQYQFFFSFLPVSFTRPFVCTFGFRFCRPFDFFDPHPRANTYNMYQLSRRYDEHASRAPVGAHVIVYNMFVPMHTGCCRAESS